MLTSDGGVQVILLRILKFRVLIRLIRVVVVFRRAHRAALILKSFKVRDAVLPTPLLAW